jgi:F-type H+-transporting ATPase subunit delta
LSTNKSFSTEAARRYALALYELAKENSVLENVEKDISSQMNLSNITKNFLSILVSKRRIFFLNKISQNFLTLVSKQKGELKTSLTSSKILTNDEIKNLNIELSQSIGKKVALDYQVDENLIGGLKMQIGSLMIDTSIKNKLKKYEQTMLEI